MLPISSNTADQGCSPVSSNCVIWQGPNLSCINLCKGDTVSDVVYKVATQLCTLQSELVLTDLDLSCLVSFCSSANPAPTTKTLAAVLDFIIDKVCCVNTRLTAVEGVSGGTSYAEPTLNLPSCLQYTNGQGQTVTQLVHNQYTLTIATKLCEIKTTVDLHTSQIASVSARVTVLEAATAASLPTISVACLTGSSALVALDEAVEVITDELCDLKGVLGTNTAITAASAKQCTQLSTLNSLSQLGTMSSITGWKTTVTTLSDSINNLWLTVCDMRGAISALKDCCGAIDCSSLVIDFTAVLNSTRDTLTIKFKGLTGYKGSTGLTGWADGYNGDGARFTIKDVSGNSQSFTIPVVSNAAAAASDLGVTISLNTGTGTNQLRTTQNYILSMNAAVSNSGTTCTRLLDKTLAAPCTTITSIGATVS
jgi:hypothetical protein